MGVLPGGVSDVDVAHGKFLNSANGSGTQSVSELDTLDQDKVNNTYKADLALPTSVFGNPLGPLGKIFGDGVAGLPDAFGQLVQALFGTAGPWGTISGAINQIEHNVIGGIQQTIVLIQAAVAAVQSFVNAIINAIVAGLRGIPLGLGTSAADQLAALTGAVKDTQNNTQNAVITQAVGGYRNPAYVSRYPVGDVTFELSLGFFFDVQGVTSTPSAGTSHTHSMTNFGVNRAGPVLYAGTQNVSRGSYVGCTVNTVYDTVAFYGAATAASPALNNAFIDVFRENPDGSLIRLNSINVTSQLVVTQPGGDIGYIEAALDPPIIANAGERYLCRIRNSSTTANGFGAFGINRSSVAPDIAFTTTTAALSNLTSYTPAQAAAARSADRAAIWFNLASVNRPVTDQSYSDTFDRVSLGGLWYQKSSNANLLNIVSKRASFIGTTAGDQVALYTAALSGDQMLVEANQYGRVAGAMAGPMSCCNRDMTQTVFLGVNASAARLFVGPWDALTDTGLSVPTTAADAKWSIYNDPSAATFTVLKDGTDVDVWPDTAGLVKHGNDYRFGGVRASRVGGVNGGTQDNWTLRDYAA